MEDYKASKAKKAAAALHRRNTRRAGYTQFTRDTHEALADILVKAGVNDSEVAAALIRETEYAAALYPKGNELVSAGEAKRRIAEFIKAANKFAAAWDALGEQLQHGVYAENLGSQALSAALCAELLKDDIGESQAHDPAAYRFVLAVADLWRRAKINPSFTNNVDAGDDVSTLFMRFIRKCAPKPIGPGIIREALSTQVLGDKSGKN